MLFNAPITDLDAADLTILANLDTGLPEIITRDDLMRHEWLRDLMLAADSISNRIGRDDLSWLKENAS